MKLFSPIAFKSNIYPVKERNGYIRMDKDFLNQIRSRKAIAYLHEQIERRFITEFMYTPNDIQKNIYRKIVCPPAYCSLYPDTQPWGEIKEADGKIKVVCKCDKKDCKGYKDCSKYIVKAIQLSESTPNTKQKEMEQWQKRYRKLRNEMEELKLRHNAVTPPVVQQVEKVEKNVSDYEKEVTAVESWIQNLTALEEKKEFDAYNAELPNKDKWLRKLSKSEAILEKKRTDLILTQYQKAAQICKEFHMNWITDWAELKPLIVSQIKNLPAELFVSDLSEKVSSLNGLKIDLEHLEDTQKNEKAICQDLYDKCTNLLSIFQTLTEKSGKSKQFLNSLIPKEVPSVIKQPPVIIDDPSTSTNSFFGSFRKVTQDEFIQYPINSRIIVNAGPGTGKTYSLIERIVHLVKDEHVDTEDILVLCFSRTATAEVLNRINERCTEDEDLEGSGWQIGTIDSYCWCLTHSDDDQTYNSATGSYEDGIRNAINFLKNEDIELPIKYIIIDEIQDIIDVRGKFILELLTHLKPDCGFAVLGDFCQAIYDFQVERRKNSFTAVQFIKKLCDISNIDKLTFEHNYRSDSRSELNQKLDELRPALINEDANDSFRKVKEIESSQFTMEDSLDDMIESVLDESIDDPDRTTGVLVRRNADVTEVASKFYEKLFEADNYLPIHIQKRKEGAYLAGWIGLFFQSYQKEYGTSKIDKNSFVEAFDSLFDDDEKEKLNLKYSASYYWEALEQCMVNDENYGKGKYDIEKLLKNISLNAWKFRENCGALLSGILQNSPIVISNVHQAKGREYDQVVLSTRILNFSNKDYDIKTNEKCRVAYVALTRSKDKVGLFKTGDFKYGAIKMTNRAYLSGKKSGNIQKIEFGTYGDLDSSSFANEEIQEYIRDELPVGEPLQLNKIICDNTLHYELAMEGGDMGVPDVLGAASHAFTGDLCALMQMKNIDQSEYHCFPKIIDALYVNDLVTFIEQDKGQGKDLPQFGDILVWNGLSVIGMGECHY